MNKQDTNVNILSSNLRQNRRQLGAVSPKAFAEVYLKNNCYEPYSKMHLEMFQKLLNITKGRKAKVAIAAPRGHANRQGFPLHKYIHHGLSSQAMLFNLVGPLIMTEKQELSPLRVTFEKHGISWPEGKLAPKFEDEDRRIFNEMTQQPTSIDLVVENKDKVRGLYIEFKFVEHEFGGCSVFKNGDCDGGNPARNRHSCYLHHIGRKYWDLLDKHGFLRGAIADNATCFLATYYQFFREVLYALEKEGVFILLVDKRNPTFSCGKDGKRGLFPFLKGFVPSRHKDKVHMVAVQEVVTAIKDLGKHSWISEFQQKYGIE